MTKACCSHPPSTPVAIDPAVQREPHRRDPTPSNPPARPRPADTIPLTHLRRGQRTVIRESRLASDDAALLRAMGLCLNATLRVCRVGEPCIIALGRMIAPSPSDATTADANACPCGRAPDCGLPACRIGLARPLAERIFVTVLA